MIIDYSRAANSKKAKEAFDITIKELEEQVETLKNKYNITWEQLEELRKDRAAIIEKTIQILKECGIKISKPLGKCNNEELNQELKKIIEALPFSEKEKIQIAMVKINNRYHEIVKRGEILDQLNIELSKISVHEKDNDREVVISLEDYKTKKKNSLENIEEKTEESIHESGEEFQKVESITIASEELLEDLSQLFQTKKSVDEENISDLTKTNREKKSAVVNPDDLEDLDDLEEKEITSFFDRNQSLKEDLSIDHFLENEEAYSKEKMEEMEEEFIPHMMKKDQTLCAIAENVYGDAKYWRELYEYGENSIEIDERASEYNITVEEAADTIGILTGLELKFPVEIITYEEVQSTEKDIKKKAA